MLTTYRDVLSRPGAARFSAAGIVARLPTSMVGIGIVLMVSTLYGSYGLAGRVSAAYLAAQAVCTPLLARLVDTHGQAVVMRPATLGAAAAMAALALAAGLHADPVWLYVAAALTGATLGSFGSLVRARWTHVLGPDAQALHTAYSWESALDEAVFIVGPIVATLLATSVAPTAGIVVPLVAVLAGGLWFLAQSDTEPATAPAGTPRARGSILAAPGVLVVVVVFVAIGTIFGGIDVSVVAFTDELGRKNLAGVVLAAFALGSMLAGLLYGARHWVAPAYRQFVIGTVLLSLGVGGLALIDSLALLVPAMVVVGLTIAPTMISGNALITELVPAGRLTEGLAWVSTALGVGVSAGSSVGGSLIDAHGSAGGFATVVGGGVLVLVTTVAALPLLRRGGREPTLT